MTLNPFSPTDDGNPEMIAAPFFRSGCLYLRAHKVVKCCSLSETRPLELRTQILRAPLSREFGLRL